MIKFKKGDKIICINKDGNIISSLIIGKIYTVTNCFYRDRDWFINIAEDKEKISWSTFQFKLIEPRVSGIVKFCEKNYV